MASHDPNEPPPPGDLEPDAGSAELGVIVIKPPQTRSGRETPVRPDGMASNVWMFGLAGVAGVILLLFLLLI